MNIIELHDKAWKTLQGRRARLPHALLLLGQKGIGKFLLARAFAKALLCEAPRADGSDCGHCLACNWFEQGNHPDFRLLQPEAMSEEGEGEEGKKKPSQQITIDQIRSLDEFFNVGTHRGGLRIVIVNPTEAMNRSTANSLLKTLEEPSSGTLFLMVSSEPMRLLPTIRSRCQVVPIPLPSLQRAVQVLEESGIKEGKRWLALAGGAPILAADMATLGHAAWMTQLTERLALGKRIDPLESAAELDKLVKDSKGKLLLKQILEAFQKWLVDLNLVRNGIPVRYFLAEERTISRLADMIPPARLIQSYRAAISHRQVAEQPLNVRLFLESLFLEYRGLFAD